MTLKFKLIKSNLLTTKKAYHAVPVLRKTINQDDLIESIIRPGSGITKSEALSMIEAYHDAICDAVENGDIVSTELFTIKSSIRGSFDNVNSSFDNKKHDIKINIASGRRLTKVTKRMKTKREDAQSIMPVIKHLLNAQKNNLTEPVSTNSLLIIKGSRLKFNPGDDRQGVYLQKEHSSELIKAGTILENTNASLMVLIPEVQPDIYKLVVKAVFSNGKVLRTAVSKETIQVV